jgi:uncharacterized Zn-finger protein
MEVFVNKLFHFLVCLFVASFLSAAEQKKAQKRKIPPVLIGQKKFYPCFECSDLFSSAGNRNRHNMAVHTKEKAYTCSVPSCKKGFSNSSNRRKHEETHVKTGEISFQLMKELQEVNTKKGKKKNFKEQAMADQTPLFCEQVLGLLQQNSEGVVDGTAALVALNKEYLSLFVIK